MQIMDWMNQIQRVFRRYVCWPRTLMHWLCIVLFLITHTAILWLGPTQVQAAMPKAAGQVTTVLTPYNTALFEAAKGNLPSAEQGRLKKLRPVVQGLKVAQASGPDLVVTTLNTPNTDATWGQSVELTWTVKNQGNLSINPGWGDKVYLSADSVWDSSDRDLSGTVAAPTKALSPGASYTVTRNIGVPYPGSTDKPYLLVVTDATNLRAEVDESNNVRALQVLAPPDLVVSAASAPTFSLGDVSFDLPVTWTVTNRSSHNAYPGWGDRIYLSADPVLDSSDRALSGTIAAPTPQLLSPGGSYTKTFSVLIPSRYTVPNITTPYLLVVTDQGNYRVETDENNNVAVVIGFQYLGFDPLKPFRDALATLTGAAAEAVAYYANLIVAGEGNISQGVATGNLGQQALGYGQAVLGYAGGLAAGLAVEENLGTTTTILGGLLFGQGLIATQAGWPIATDRVISTALNTYGFASDVADLNRAVTDSSLSLPERIATGAYALWGIATPGSNFDPNTVRKGIGVSEFDISPSTPVGSRGYQIQIPPPANVATTVGGRQYSGHALDRMQEQGMVPTVVENAIQSGQKTTGKIPGTTAYYDSVNDLTVITDTASGRVVTAKYGYIKQ
jgi:hypothetical protein